MARKVVSTRHCGDLTNLPAWLETGEGDCVTEKRLFGTMTQELHALAQWLQQGETDIVQTL